MSLLDCEAPHSATTPAPTRYHVPCPAHHPFFCLWPRVGRRTDRCLYLLGLGGSNHLLRNGTNAAGDSETAGGGGAGAGAGGELSTTIFAQPFNELLVWAVLTKRQATSPDFVLFFVDETDSIEFRRFRQRLLGLVGLYWVSQDFT